MFARDLDGDAPQRVLATLPDEEADGLAVDDEGGIWIAQPWAQRLVRLTPDGEVDGMETVGVNVASLAFDGDVLYLTTIAMGDEAGALLRAAAPVPGPRHHLATI